MKLRKIYSININILFWGAAILRYKLISKTKCEKPNRPFIVPLMYYIMGFLFFCLIIIFLLFGGKINSISDAVGTALIIILLGGAGLTSIWVGYKMRKW